MTTLAPLLLPLGLIFLLASTACLVVTIRAKSNRARVPGGKLWKQVFFSGFTAGLSYFSGEILAAQVWALSLVVLISSIILIAVEKEKIMQAMRRR